MKVPSIRSLFARVLRVPFSALGMTQAPSNAEGPIPRSFSEAMRFGERERSMSPLEHSGVQPIGTPEFDHINYDERRKRDDSAA